MTIWCIWFFTVFADLPNMLPTSLYERAISWCSKNTERILFSWLLNLLISNLQLWIAFGWTGLAVQSGRCVGLVCLSDRPIGWLVRISSRFVSFWLCSFKRAEFSSISFWCFCRTLFIESTWPLMLAICCFTVMPQPFDLLLLAVLSFLLIKKSSSPILRFSRPSHWSRGNKTAGIVYSALFGIRSSCPG